jgi:hypothetical protein
MQHHQIHSRQDADGERGKAKDKSVREGCVQMMLQLSYVVKKHITKLALIQN